MKGNEMPRSLKEIAVEIGNDWPKVKDYGTPGPFGNMGQHPANPYWDAMQRLNKITDSYFADDAESVVRYFLSNAAGWRGENAKRIKSELKAMLPKR